MSTPTPKELVLALKTAGQMREHSIDSHFLAKSLLSCHYQEHYLQEVLHCAELYLRNGLSEIDHSRLVRAIEKARKAQMHNAKKEEPALGL